MQTRQPATRQSNTLLAGLLPYIESYINLHINKNLLLSESDDVISYIVQDEWVTYSISKEGVYFQY